MCVRVRVHGAYLCFSKAVLRSRFVRMVAALEGTEDESEIMLNGYLCSYLVSCAPMRTCVRA